MSKSKIENATYILFVQNIFSPLRALVILNHVGSLPEEKTLDRVFFPTFIAPLPKWTKVENELNTLYENSTIFN